MIKVAGLRSVDVLRDSRLLELWNCFEEHAAFKPKVKISKWSMKDRNEWMNKQKVKRCFVAHPGWTIRGAIRSDKLRQPPWTTDWIREQHWSWKGRRWKFYQHFQHIVSLFYFIEHKAEFKTKTVCVRTLRIRKYFPLYLYRESVRIVYSPSINPLNIGMNECEDLDDLPFHQTFSGMNQLVSMSSYA